MSLAPQLSAVVEGFQQKAPPQIVSTINETNEKFAASFSAVVKVGDKLPPFAMSDALDKEVTSAELLSRGPILITFYRGQWCPFCNLALHALQANFEKFQVQGVTLVAISPQLPDSSL